MNINKVRISIEFNCHIVINWYMNEKQNIHTKAYINKITPSIFKIM